MARPALFPIDEKTLEYLELRPAAPQDIALTEAYGGAGLLAANDETTKERDLHKNAGSRHQPWCRRLSGPNCAAARVDGRSRTRVQPRSERKCSASTMMAKRVACPTARTAGLCPWRCPAIAAITTAQTTSNPHVLIAAGLVARKAREAGLAAQAVVQELRWRRDRRLSPTFFDKAGLART